MTFSYNTITTTPYPARLSWCLLVKVKRSFYFSTCNFCLNTCSSIILLEAVKFFSPSSTRLRLRLRWPVLEEFQDGIDVRFQCDGYEVDFDSSKFQIYIYSDLYSSRMQPDFDIWVGRAREGTFTHNKEIYYKWETIIPQDRTLRSIPYTIVNICEASNDLKTVIRMYSHTDVFKGV